MRKHKGEHPGMGATDVCPLIPITGFHGRMCKIFPSISKKGRR